MTSAAIEDRIRDAAEAIAKADALMIGAGAGMGVDSGLPDFRGSAGFWRAYPAYARLNLDFAAMANPRWFRDDPALAWGFYGHRLALYRQTRPHPGFAILRRWGDRMSRGAFAFTSNVDGQFQRAGFGPDRVAEVHGAIGRLQCTGDCGIEPFPAEGVEVRIDEATMRAIEPLPRCGRCGSLARPNILMFGDLDWDSSPTDAQLAHLQAWLGCLGKGRLVVIECGAGTAIPTIRRSCEALATRMRGILVRINPREPEVSPGQVALPLGALDALRAIDEWLDGLSGP